MTGHGCLGVVILLWGRQCAAELCPGMVFPTPYPQGYGGTPPEPRPGAYRQAGSPEHARGAARHATVAALYRWFARDSPDGGSGAFRVVRPGPAVTEEPAVR
ncbi:hypothetical protein GCM10010297_33580 [Streptomyces malachitofuscus]|nr:hypothetical protein GCM10010297_33580 [Streptomyces malachitofuscus]